MAINTERTVRKLFTMPRELSDRVDAFRQSRGLRTEAEALRDLIEAGLLARETPEDLIAKCEAAQAEGRSLSWIAANIIEPHPLRGPEDEVWINRDGLSVALTLRDRDPLLVCRLRYVADIKKWVYTEQFGVV